jgi:hypothetical protein
MKVRVKQCCHTQDVEPVHDAGVGDIVLLRATDGRYFEASLREVKSPSTVVVAFMVGAEEILKEIEATEIEALMLGD